MVEHRQTFINIKSDLLDICIESFDNQRSGYFKKLEQCFLNNFNIKKISLLVFEKDMLKPFHEESPFDLSNRQLSWTEFEPPFKQGMVMNVPSPIQKMKEYKDLSQMMLLESEHHTKNGILLLEETDEWKSFFYSDYFEEFVHIFSKFFDKLLKHVEVRLNENQYRKLYSMTDLFHSTMDIDLILKNVLMTIQENFPQFHVELILSNDQDRQTTINAKPFDYLSERQSVIEAFVSGTSTTEQVEDLQVCILNAPLKGRQAIYGILQVSGPLGYTFSPMQMDFIKMLAQASGNALENAKLYHQSHRLISDLQLINETTHRLNMKLTMNEMVTFLQKQLMKSIKPMEIGFVFKEKGKFVLSDVSTYLFKSDDCSMYINYVVKHFENSQEPLFIADFSRLASKEVRYHSMMAIPMIVEQRIYGFCIVLHEESYFFSFDSFKLIQSLIQHSSLAIANSVLRNQLQVMVDHDHLTKLHSRAFLDKFVARSLKNDHCGMFLLFDIDNFKQVNDTYGHQVGDKVLVQIAEQLQKIVGTRGICARWGGEEMAVYVPNMHDDESIVLTNQIVTAIPQVTNPEVTVSAGLVMWKRSSRPEFQTLFLEADSALYQAKNNGKNQVCIFNENTPRQS